jgi:DNA polymerase
MDYSSCIFLDFEARSEVDITEVGAYAYAEHPTTEILCCAWVVGLTNEIQLWRPGEPLWFEIAEYPGIWVAHNKDTERLLLKHKLGLEVPPELWIDCATATSAAGMPRNLHDVAESLHLSIQKLSRTAMLKLARPRKQTKTNSAKWWTREDAADDYATMEDYCKRDVDLMRKALVRLPPYEAILPAKEQRLGVITDKMNDRGVEVDLAGVRRAADVVAEHGARLRAEFAEVMPGVNPKHPPSVAKALGLDNVRKETVRDELAGCTDPKARRALTLLKTIKTASTAKLNAFMRHACSDGRIRGAIVFHGAGRTGRWSSMGVQLQNLVRGLGVSTPDWPAVDSSPDAMDIFFEMLHGGILDMAYSDPTRATAAAMRGFLLDSERGLLMGDYSQIEARVLVSWAGQMDMVEAFRQKKDPYKLMAARIYNKSMETVTKDERFMGKQSVLGAGYGVGVHGFLAMLKVQYDVVIPESEAQRIIDAYRASNRKVVSLWWSMDSLAKKVVAEKPDRFIASDSVPRIGMRMYRDWLVMRLPSGRCLWYFEPELVENGRSIVYWGRNVMKGGKWDRVKTYGGKLVENGTQAIARDAMAEGMIRLDDAGFPLEMTVHDELVAPGSPDELDRFGALMKQAPAWWPDLPLDVEVQHKKRYQK